MFLLLILSEIRLCYKCGGLFYNLNKKYNINIEEFFTELSNIMWFYFGDQTMENIINDQIRTNIWEIKAGQRLGILS